MDEKMIEQAVNKPLEQVLRDGQEILAMAENDWSLLPQETRDHILIETVDCAEVEATSSITVALHMMLKVGYYYGCANGYPNKV